MTCRNTLICDVQNGGRLRACLPGDENVVNCLEQHPWLPLTLATSGALLDFMQTRLLFQSQAFNHS